MSFTEHLFHAGYHSNYFLPAFHGTESPPFPMRHWFTKLCTVTKAKNGLDQVSGLSCHWPPIGDVGKNNHEAEPQVSAKCRGPAGSHTCLLHPPLGGAGPRGSGPGMRGLTKCGPGRPPAGQTAGVQPRRPASPPLPHHRCSLGAHCELGTALSVEMQSDSDGKPSSPRGAYSLTGEADIHQQP